MKSERTEPYHVDVVRRVESGHVLVLESHDLEELVGEMADMQAENWRIVGLVTGMFDRYGEATTQTVMYTALLVRGIPGSPLGMEMGSEDG